MSISNVMNTIFLDLSHPDFIKEFFSNQHLYDYPKHGTLVYAYKSAMGEGVPFSEGGVWKRKRKIISKVFNFDLISKITPKISKICDAALEELESKSKLEGED